VTTAVRPLPLPDHRSQEFYAAAAEGRLLIQACDACGALQFYPRGHCVRCSGSALSWRQASGRATLHTFSVLYRTPNVEFADDLPYVLAIVDLEEGVRMTSRVVDVDLERLRCELPLQVVFRPLAEDGPVMPFFTEREAA
jgi:uncharacterized protein